MRKTSSRTILFLALFAFGNPARAAELGELGELNELDASSRSSLVFQSGDTAFGFSLGYSRLVAPSIQLTGNFDLGIGTVKSSSSGVSNTTTSFTLAAGPTFNFADTDRLGNAFFLLPQIYFVAVSNRTSAATFGGILTFGKRFAVNDSVSYAPYLTLSERFSSSDYFNTDLRTAVVPLAFTFFL
ncbi:MAG: hypothetical protein H7222_13795 [Methylotenera sp.]|nr:hypothetical protein [Oligoflexia bacterium]